MTVNGWNDNQTAVAASEQQARSRSDTAVNEEVKAQGPSDKEFYEQPGSTFFPELARKAGKVVRYATLIRLTINILMSRFNLKKAL